METNNSDNIRRSHRTRNLHPTDKRLVEMFLGSRGRVRILKVFTEERELNHSKICRRVGMNYHNVNTHLERLKELGMINEKTYSNIRMFESLSVRLISNSGIRG